MADKRVLVGVIAGAHGIKGEVRAKSYTAEPGDLGAYGPVSTEDGTILAIERLRPTKDDILIVKFAGISDRNAAEILKGKSLFVARDRLPEAAAGSYYLIDLIGLRAEDPQGVPVGKVLAVHNFGAGDIVEIEHPNGTAEFIAFNDTNVPLVDIAAGRIVVQFPPSGD